MGLQSISIKIDFCWLHYNILHISASFDKAIKTGIWYEFNDHSLRHVMSYLLLCVRTIIIMELYSTILTHIYINKYRFLFQQHSMQHETNRINDYYQFTYISNE